MKYCSSTDSYRGIVGFYGGIDLMNKQPEVCERTKANLLEAFWKVYNKNTLYKVRIKEITDKAGYNRSTFYQYFSDINDILEYGENILINEILQHLESTMENLNSKDIIAKTAEAYEKYGYYLSKLLGPTGDPSFAEKYKNAIKPLLFKKFNLEEDDLRVDVLCEYCLGAIVSSITYWHNNKTFSAEELATLLHNLITYGMFSVLK